MRMQQRKRRWEISPRFKRLLHLFMNAAIHDVGKAVEIIFVIVNNRLILNACVVQRSMGQGHTLHHPLPFGWLLEKHDPCASYLLYRCFTNTLVRAECVAALRQSDRLDMWFALRRVMLKFF